MSKPKFGQCEIASLKQFLLYDYKSNMQILHYIHIFGGRRIAGLYWNPLNIFRTSFLYDTHDSSDTLKAMDIWTFYGNLGMVIVRWRTVDEPLR